MYSLTHQAPLPKSHLRRLQSPEVQATSIPMLCITFSLLHLSSPGPHDKTPPKETQGTIFLVLFFYKGRNLGFRLS